MTTASVDHVAGEWEKPSALWTALATVDHKKIGVRYLVTAVSFLLIGGVEAVGIRLQLSTAESKLMNAELYDQVFTLHGVTMIFWYAQPILSAFGNYMLPLMLGARDMALPRLNAFSYWTFLFSGLFLYSSVLVGQVPNGGWFAYVPYTTRDFSPGLNMDFYALSLVFLTISTTSGAINFILTILRFRAPGMAVSRMPLFAYSTLTTSALAVVSLPALTVACVFLELDRHWNTHFFDVAQGGLPLLWQHVFWFFGHPWVYVIFLPATGMISMIVPVFSRRPIVGYPYVALATVLTGVVGMGVWVHHMFTVGMSQLSMSLFSAASITISLFSTVQVFAWLSTVWHGRPVLTASMKFALGFIALFVIGGLSGVVTALVPFDWQITDTYFVVAHLHYVLVGANVFPVFAGLYYWLPKMTGRLMNERAGNWSFWLMFIGFTIAFFPMHLLGLAGMPRRIYTYTPGMGWERLNLIITAGAAVLALGVAVSVVNFLVSARRGADAGPDPWKADTLEWSHSSPPTPEAPHLVHVVSSRAPLWEPHTERGEPVEVRLPPGRIALATTVLDAVPQAIARVPNETITPLLLAAALASVFVALLLRVPWAMAITALVSALCVAAWLWPEKEHAA